MSTFLQNVHQIWNRNQFSDSGKGVQVDWPMCGKIWLELGNVNALYDISSVSILPRSFHIRTMALVLPEMFFAQMSAYLIYFCQQVLLQISPLLI